MQEKQSHSLVLVLCKLGTLKNPADGVVIVPAEFGLPLYAEPITKNKLLKNTYKKT